MFLTARENPLSTFSIDVDTASLREMCGGFCRMINCRRVGDPHGGADQLFHLRLCEARERFAVLR